MEMRRKDLAVTDDAAIDAIINSCDCFRLALADGTRPYIIPLNFGFVHKDGVRTFYFHSAKVGRKVDLCRALGYAGFELDTDRKVNTNDTACDFSMGYKSVVGEGDVVEVTDYAEKVDALKTLMAHYSRHTQWEFPQKAVDATCVFRLTVKEISARQHK